MKLSVIIVNYNVKYFLEHCLCSVIKASAGIDAEIFVIDNNSTDESKEYLEPKFPQVNFKWNKKNEGFAKANNSVLGEAKGEHILFLNPDTIIPEDCFTKCLDFFNAQKNCAAVGVRMLDGSGKFLRESKRSFPSMLTSFFKLAGFTALFPSSKLFARYYAGHLAEKQNGEVDVLAGAFMMLSREALAKMEGFDEDYFMYGEDIDLSYRLQKAGYKNYYFADTSIIHFKGESTQKRSYDYIRNFYAAMQLFVAKHYKDRKTTVFFMKTSIGFSRMMASVKLSFRRMIGAGNGSNIVNIAVVAGQKRFDEMIHLLKYASVPVVIKGRISPSENDSGVVIGKLEEAGQLVKKLSIDGIVFCEAELSYKQIIERLEQLAAKTGFLFHSKGSSSIVGSSSKNNKGIFIAKP